MLHSIFHLISDLFIFIINLGVVVYILMIITFDYRHFDMLENLWNNWNTHLVSELYLYENDKQIESKQILVSLFNYTFEGMRRGCDCGFASNPNKDMSEFDWGGKIDEGDCSIKQILLGCTQINDKGKEHYSKINDIAISLTRNEEFGYIKNYASEIDNDCSGDNTKDCGIIDTINNRLCIPESKECPSIIIHDSISIDYNSNDNDLMRELAKKMKEKPLTNVSFKLSIDKICVNEAESPLTSNISFPLLILKETSDFYPDRNEMMMNIYCYTSLIDNQTIDSRYTLQLSSQFSSIFSYELKAYLKQIPSFPYNSFIKSNLNLYSIGYVGWSKNCSHYILNIKPLTNIKYHLKGFFTLYLINGLIILPYFLLFIMIIAQIDYSNLRLHLTLFFSHFVLILIFGTMIYSDYSGINRVKDVISEISRKVCSDNETNKLFYNLMKDIREIEEVISFILLWIELMGFGSLIKIFLVISKQNKRKIMASLMNSNIPLISRVEIEMVTI